jgi:hypothetical protein
MRLARHRKIEEAHRQREMPDARIADLALG